MTPVATGVVPVRANFGGVSSRFTGPSGIRSSPTAQERGSADVGSNLDFENLLGNALCDEQGLARRLLRVQLNRFRGRELNTSGDGFLAMFDGPQRAIRCAVAIREAVQALGIAVRAGLHTGEFNERGTYELKGVPGEWRLFAVATT